MTPTLYSLDRETHWDENKGVTKEDLIQKLKALPEAEFARVAPFIEADLEVADDLGTLQQEIAAGRQSAKTEPILEAKEAYARVRRALTK